MKTRLILLQTASLLLALTAASGQLVSPPSLKPNQGPVKSGGYLDTSPIPLDPLAPAAPAPSATPGKSQFLGRRENQVYAVWVSNNVSPNGSLYHSGGGTPVTIRVEQNHTGEPAVGATEGTPGGLGEQWKSSFWMAAYNAARLTDHVLADYEFTIKVGSGKVDGPSASMLLSAAMLALLRGDDLLPGTTMTGTINPDGTCGPVGGIPHKMEGIKSMEKSLSEAAGSPVVFRRFGYPIGSRTALDMNTQALIDLHEHGRDLGFAEVREIADIYDAYEFLTGKVLEKPTPLSEAEMELPLSIRQKLRAKLQATSSRIEAELPRLKERLKKMKSAPADLLNVLTELDDARNRYENYTSSSLEEAAYAELFMRHTVIRMLNIVLELGEHFDTQNMDGVNACLASVRSIQGTLNSLQLEAASLAISDSLGARMTAIEALMYYSTAVSLKDRSEALLQELGQKLQAASKSKSKSGSVSLDDFKQSIMLAVSFAAMANSFATQAQDWLNVGTDETTLKSTQEDRIKRFSTSMTSVAGATASYFESVIITPMAAGAGVSKEVAQQKFSESDLGYILAKSASRAAEFIARFFPNRPNERNNYQIAFSSIAFIFSSSLINRDYSLGYTAAHATDPKLMLSNRKALSSQLDLARQHAREAAGLCKQRLGFVPWNIRINYQLGKAYRDGTRDIEKLQALVAFWQATLSAEIALQLVDR